METKLADTNYESRGIRSAKELVIGEENIGEHPFSDAGYCTELGYSAVKVGLPKGYRLSRICRKGDDSYLILQKE